MSLVFRVLVDVFLREAAEKDAVETRVEPVQVGATHVTDTRLGLERKQTRGRTTGKERRRVSAVRESSAAGHSPEL